MRPLAQVVESKRPCHLCLVKDVQCIVAIASSRSVSLTVVAMTRIALVMALPRDGAVASAIVAMAAGKILQRHPKGVLSEGNSLVTLSICLSPSFLYPFTTITGFSRATSVAKPA